MKRPEERLTPGRKRIYEEGKSMSIYVPQPLLDRIAKVELLDASSRNAKIVQLLEIALDHLDELPE